MKDFKGTKGGWSVTNQADDWGSTLNDIIISDQKEGRDKRKVVARAWLLADGINNVALKKEFEANAKLIAAAPDLLEALQAYVNDDWAGSLKNQNAIAAIKKALG